MALSNAQRQARLQARRKAAVIEYNALHEEFVTLTCERDNLRAKADDLMVALMHAAHFVTSPADREEWIALGGPNVKLAILLHDGEERRFAEMDDPKPAVTNEPAPQPTTSVSNDRLADDDLKAIIADLAAREGRVPSVKAVRKALDGRPAGELRIRRLLANAKAGETRPTVSNDEASEATVSNQPAPAAPAVVSNAMTLGKIDADIEAKIRATVTEMMGDGKRLPGHKRIVDALADNLLRWRIDRHTLEWRVKTALRRVLTSQRAAETRARNAASKASVTIEPKAPRQGAVTNGPTAKKADAAPAAPTKIKDGLRIDGHDYTLNLDSVMCDGKRSGLYARRRKLVGTGGKSQPPLVYEWVVGWWEQKGPPDVYPTRDEAIIAAAKAHIEASQAPAAPVEKPPPAAPAAKSAFVPTFLRGSAANRQGVEKAADGAGQGEGEG